MTSDRLHHRNPGDLYRSSIVVTGSHYSMTTLLGDILARSPSFHLVTEPFNQRPPLEIRTLALPHMYEYLDEEGYLRVRPQLEDLIAGRALAGEVIRKLGQIRSAADLRSLYRLAKDGLPLRLAPRPAIIKDPFLAFTARTMQQLDGMRVVLGVRHPCRWVESIVRTDGGFNFEQWVEQPAVLDALPHLADRIAHFAREPQPPVLQAAFAWVCFQTFHARSLLGNELTLVVRQQAIVSRPREWCERLYRFAGVDVPPALDSFIARTFRARAVDHAEGDPNYTQRDAQAVLEKWRQRLTREEQQQIRRETEEVAALFGFGEADWAGVG